MKSFALQRCLSELDNMATVPLERCLSERKRMVRWYLERIYMAEFVIQVMGGGGIETNWNAV
jgi:hypothetical protein